MWNPSLRLQMLQLDGPWLADWWLGSCLALGGKLKTCSSCSERIFESVSTPGPEHLVTRQPPGHRFVDERHTVSYSVIQIHTDSYSAFYLWGSMSSHWLFLTRWLNATRLVFQHISTSKAIFPVHFAVKSALLSGTKTHFCPWIFVALRQVMGRYTSQLPSCACCAKIT